MLLIKLVWIGGGNMKRNRSMALVTRGDRILLVEHHYFDRSFYILPGGGIEAGETPEQAAIRELAEECNVKGKIIRPITQTFKEDGRMEYIFEVGVDEDAVISKGLDPELPPEKQIIRSVAWKTLRELNERDRAYLWSYGLIRIKQFHEEALAWGDDISYPGQ